MLNEKHRHKMEKIITDKVPLYNVKLINGKRNELLVGYDTFTSKQCKCGFKQPIKVERQAMFNERREDES